MFFETGVSVSLEDTCLKNLYSCYFYSHRPQRDNLVVYTKLMQLKKERVLCSIGSETFKKYIPSDNVLMQFLH